MRLPTTTGQAAWVLGYLEPSLNDRIRRGKLSAPPRVTSGRRLWTRDDIVRAADDLGVSRTEVDERLNEQEVGAA